MDQQNLNTREDVSSIHKFENARLSANISYENTFYFFTITICP